MPKPNFKKSKGMQHLSEIAQKSNENVNTQQIVNIDVSKISFNPRNEETFGMSQAEIETLAEDIKKNGFVGCIEIFKKENSEEYEIQAGHKRYMANSLAGNKTIPSVIVKKNRRRFISDNTNQRNFTFLQNARCILEWEEVLREEGFEGDMREEVARQMHMSPSQVYKYKSILNLIPPLQALLQEEKVSFSSSSAIAGIKSEEQQKEIYDLFVQYMNAHDQDSISRDVADKIIRNVKNGIKEYVTAEPVDAEVKQEEIEKTITKPSQEEMDVVLEEMNQEEVGDITLAEPEPRQEEMNVVLEEMNQEEVGDITLAEPEPRQEEMNVVLEEMIQEKIGDIPIEPNQEEVEEVPTELNEEGILKELKPCPFCGGKAQLRQFANPKNFYEIRCSICGCGTDGHFQSVVSNTVIENQKINIAVWNSRVDE